MAVDADGISFFGGAGGRVLGLLGNQVAALMGWQGRHPEKFKDPALYYVRVTTFVEGGTKGGNKNGFQRLFLR